MSPFLALHPHTHTTLCSHRVGVYMLTEPYGLDYITHCEEEGFHTHPKEPPLYEECSHVVFSQSPIEVVDLR
jgi:STAM-binding protein